MEGFLERCRGIQPPDEGFLSRARARQLELTKPPLSLGRLEDIACQLCAIQRSLAPTIAEPHVLLFAADHGITAHETVSPYPRQVTAQMVANIATGGAAINALARAAGARIELVDVGVDGAPSGFAKLAPDVRYTHAPVARGTASFLQGPAMSADEARQALEIGWETAERARQVGANVVLLGEIGIGNTTVAAALAHALTGATVESVVGRGTGADDVMLTKKRDVVERAVALHRGAAPPFELLRRLGGFEFAAMAGAALGAARAQMAVIADGFISTTAVALAVAACPSLRGYVFVAHRSAERGHGAMLEHSKLTPLLDLGMRLGEGSGAALALPLLRAAVACFVEMATFSEAAVSDRA